MSFELLVIVGSILAGGIAGLASRRLPNSGKLALASCLAPAAGFGLFASNVFC